jgi:hypothetical protein
MEERMKKRLEELRALRERRIIELAAIEAVIAELTALLEPPQPEETPAEQ